MIRDIKEFTELYNVVATNILKAKNIERDYWNEFVHEIKAQALGNFEDINFDSIDKYNNQWLGAKIILDTLGIDTIKEDRAILPHWYIEHVENMIARNKA